MAFFNLIPGEGEWPRMVQAAAESANGEKYLCGARGQQFLANAYFFSLKPAGIDMSASLTEVAIFNNS